MAVYALLGLVALVPASLDPVGTKVGAFAISDSLDTVYRLWAEGNAVVETEDGRPWNPLVGAPAGVPVAPVHHPVWWLARAATALGGAVFGYNAAVFSSFVLAGLFAHLLVRRLGGGEPAALFAGVAFAWSPFHVLQAGDHIHLAQTWVVPLYFLALGVDRERRSLASAAAVCAAFALSIWIHPYYGAFLGIATPWLLAYAFLRDPDARAERAWLRPLGLLVALVVIAALGSTTLQIADAGGERSALVERPLEHLEMLAVRWYEWLLPPFYSLLFGEPVRGFLATRTHGSSAAEMTVFLGFVPLVLAVIGVARSRGGDVRERMLVDWLLLAGLLGVLLSTRPVMELAGASLTMPSGWLYELLPMLRAISRWAVLPILAVSCLGGLGVASLSRGWAPRKAWALSLACVGLVMLEFLPSHAGLALDTRRVPKVYDAVRVLPDDAVVLELPVTALNDFIPFFWQMHHQRCLFNVPGEGHPHSDEVLAFMESDLAGVVARGQRLGIDHVVIHSARALPLGHSFPPVVGPEVIVPPGLPHATLLPIPPPPGGWPAGRCRLPR